MQRESSLHFSTRVFRATCCTERSTSFTRAFNESIFCFINQINSPFLLYILFLYARRRSLTGETRRDLACASTWRKFHALVEEAWHLLRGERVLCLFAENPIRKCQKILASCNKQMREKDRFYLASEPLPIFFARTWSFGDFSVNPSILPTPGRIWCTDLADLSMLRQMVAARVTQCPRESKNFLTPGIPSASNI